MTIASSRLGNVDRQYIRAKVMQFGQSFIDSRGKSKSFCPIEVSKAYELDYLAVYDVLLRMVDAGQLRRTKQGRYFWT